MFVALTEEQAAELILVRSVEERDEDAFSSDILTEAVKYTGSNIRETTWLLKRASFLIDKLPAHYRMILPMARLPEPWVVPVCVFALGVGFATNLLGPADKIHVVRNPAALFVGWNLLVYLGLILLSFRKRLLRLDCTGPKRGEAHPADGQGATGQAKPPSAPWFLEYILPGLWRLSHAATSRYRQTKNFAAIVWSFWGHWLEAAGPLVTARSRQLLHFGATALAVGATLGMYFRGLFKGYDVVWVSTYITSGESVAAFIDVIFGPAFFISRLAGVPLREKVEIARLLGPEGDPAGPWIHLFAITVVLAVVLPRAVLAAWQQGKIRKLKSHLPLLFDRYYGEILTSPVRCLIEQEVREGMNRLAEDVASYVCVELYDRQIVPRLEDFRENGGRVVDLRSDIRAATEAFAPAIRSFVSERAAPDFQRSLSGNIEKIAKGIGSYFYGLKEPDELAARIRIAAPTGSADAIGHGYGDAIGGAITVSIAAGLGTISGGFGHSLGLGIITVLLGTTGPIGFLIGAMIGIIAAGGAWWLGRDQITEFVENIELPAAVVRSTLWKSQFQQLVETGRKQCRESLKRGIDEQTALLMPGITEEILLAVRRLWET